MAFAISSKQLLVSLYKNHICAFIEFRPHNLHRTIVMGDGVFPLLPCKSLYFGGFKKIIELRKQLRELPACFHGLRQLHEILHAFGTEHRSNLLETCIHQTHVFRQFLHEQIKWLISGIQFHRRFDIPFHGMRLAVVANRSEGLIRAEQSVRTAERLNDVLVIDDLVEIQRVDPLGIEARQHLVDHDQQIDPLLTMLVDG